MKPFAGFALVAAAAASSAFAGAWPQQLDHGLSINQAGQAYREGGRRLLFEGYGEAGLGDGLTVIFSFDSDQNHGSGESMWRAGAGLRYSFQTALAPSWWFAAEAGGRYQGRQSVVVDPVFAGDGLGASIRLDAGRSFEIFDLHAYANFSVAYVGRRFAPAEKKIEFVSGVDLSEDWQAGFGYFATFAPGAFYEPGAYEKHEAQLSLRWRIDADYALSISASRSFLTDRTPEETTLRLALWTFFWPEE